MMFIVVAVIMFIYSVWIAFGWITLAYKQRDSFLTTVGMLLIIMIFYFFYIVFTHVTTLHQ